MQAFVPRKSIIFLLGAVFASSEIIYVKQNGIVVLPCNDSFQDPNIWLGPPNFTTYYSVNKINPKLPQYRRLSIEETKGEQPQFNLKIFNFSKQDVGVYKCMDQKDSFFDLRIPVNPSNMTINGENGTQVLSGIEGVSLNLICRVVSGDPVEEISLTSENMTLNKSSKGTVIYSVIPQRKDHMRNITCTAVVEQTSFILQRSVQIDLKLRPVISIIPGPTITAVENEKLTINCTFTSNNPIKQIKWTFNRSDGSNNVLSNIHDISVLFFSNIKRQDSGTYTCTVENMVGAASSSVILNIPYLDFNYNDNASGKLLRCLPFGLQRDYTFLSWEHKTEYGEHLRFLRNEIGDLMFAYGHGNKNWTYQNGVYVCSVSTSMSVDKSIVLSSEYLIAEPGPPHFVSSNSKIQYGSLRSVATIVADFISYTAENNVTVSDNFLEEANYSIERNVKINEMLFGKYVALNGSRIYIQKTLRSLNDFKHYPIKVSNMFGSSVFTVYLNQLKLEENEPNYTVYGVIPLVLFGITALIIVFFLFFKKKKRIDLLRISCFKRESVPVVDVVGAVENEIYEMQNNNPAHASNTEENGVPVYSSIERRQEMCHGHMVSYCASEKEKPNPLKCQQTVTGACADLNDSQKTVDLANSQQLNYVDICFDQSASTRNFRIHGIEKKSPYAEIDFSRTTDIKRVSCSIQDSDDDDFVSLEDVRRMKRKTALKN